jgi:PAS domain S-box-containing protein
MKLQNRIIQTTIFISLIIWIIDSLIDHYFFYEKHTFLQMAITDIPPQELLMRLFYIAIIIVFALISNKYFKEKEKNTAQMSDIIEELNLTLNSITDGFIQIDPEKKIKKMNPVAEKITGYSDQESLGKSIDDIYKPLQIQAVNNDSISINELLNSDDDKYERHEMQLKNRVGKMYFLSESASAIKDQNGVVIGVIIIIRDITEEKESENRLIQSEHKFYRIYSLSPDAVVIARKRDAMILDVNKSFIRIFGYEKKLLINQVKLDELIWQNEAAKKSFYDSFHTKNNVIQYEAKLNTKDGNTIIGLISVSNIQLQEEPCLIYYIQDITQSKEAELMLLAATEELEAIVNERTEELTIANVELEKINEEVTREIHERAFAEEALKSSERKFRSLLEQLPIGVYRSAVNGEIIEANDALAKILGYDKAKDVIGVSAYDFYDSYVTRNEVINKGVELGKYVKEELRLKKKDGTYIWVHDNGQVIFDKDGDPLYTDGILEDITERKEAEDALIASEKKYRALFENLHDIFFILNKKAIIIESSPSVEIVLGYSLKEIIGRSIVDLLANSSDKIKFFRQVLKNQKVASFTLPILKNDGSIVHLAADFNIIRDHNGDIVTLEGIARNVTTDIKYQKFLSAVYEISKAVNTTETLEELYPIIHSSINQLIEAKNFVIAIYHKEKGIIQFPYLVDEKDDFIPTVSISNEDSLTVRVIRSEKPLMLKRQDILDLVDMEEGEAVGSLSQVWLGVPLKIKGEVIGAIIVQSYTNENAYKQEDITLMQSVSDQIASAIQRKRSEIELGFQLDFLQNLIDTIPNPIFYKETNRRYFIGCNKAFEEFHNSKREDIIGRSVYDLFKPEQALLYDTKDLELINSGGTQIYEAIAYTIDGKRRDVVFYKSVFHDNDGRVGGIVGVILDITEMKKQEEALREAREYAELILKLTPSSIFTVDKECVITSWNQRIARLTGFSAEEAVGQKCSIISPEREDCKECVLFANKYRKPIYDRESIIITKDGKERLVSKNVDLLYDSKGNIIGGIESFEDITQRKKAEEELQWQSNLNSSLAAISRSIFSYTSIEQIAELVLNDTLIITKSDHGFICNIDSKTGDIYVIAKSDRIPFILSDNDKGNLTNTNGPWSYVLKTQSSLISNDPETDTRFEDVAANSIEPFGKILSTPGISGNEISCLIFVSRNENDYTDQDKEVIERLSSLLSIAVKRIQAEEEVRAALEKEQELNELKSRFISMVSHEYRTPLTAIILSTELLSDYADKLTPENREKYFYRIRNAVKTMNNLLDDIITYNKVQIGKIEFKPDYVDIEQMCLNLTREMQFLAKEKHNINLVVNNGDILANIDEKIVRQILINIISNAIRYSPENSNIDFHVNTNEDNVVFIIKDQGIGIPAEDILKVYDPFFRGSNLETQSGSGLGLSVAKNYVDAHRGEISFESTNGEGTTFYVTIPFYQNKKIDKKYV